MNQHSNRDLRWLLAVIAACLLFLCVRPSTATATARRIADPVETTSLVLVDETGRACARLEVKDGKPQLVFLDESGATRVELGINKKNRASVLLADGAGAMTSEWHCTEEGAGMFGFKENGIQRVRLGALPEAGTWLELHHGKGGRAELRAMSAGESDLVLSDAKGRLRVALSLLTNGLAGLSLFDPENQAEAALYVDGKSNSGLSLIDQSRRVRASVGSKIHTKRREVESTGGAAFRSFDTDEQPQWEAPPR